MDENELQRYKAAIMSQLQLVKEVGGLPHPKCRLHKFVKYMGM